MHDFPAAMHGPCRPGINDVACWPDGVAMAARVGRGRAEGPTGGRASSRSRGRRRGHVGELRATVRRTGLVRFRPPAVPVARDILAWLAVPWRLLLTAHCWYWREIREKQQQGDGCRPEHACACQAVSRHMWPRDAEDDARAGSEIGSGGG